MPFLIMQSTIGAAAKRRRVENSTYVFDSADSHITQPYIAVYKKVNLFKKVPCGYVEAYIPNTIEYVLTRDFTRKLTFSSYGLIDIDDAVKNLNKKYCEDGFVFKSKTDDVREVYLTDKDGNDVIREIHGFD